MTRVLLTALLALAATSAAYTPAESFPSGDKSHWSTSEYAPGYHGYKDGYYGSKYDGYFDDGSHVGKYYWDHNNKNHWNNKPNHHGKNHWNNNPSHHGKNHWNNKPHYPRHPHNHWDKYDGGAWDKGYGSGDWGKEQPGYGYIAPASGPGSCSYDSFGVYAKPSPLTAHYGHASRRGGHTAKASDETMLGLLRQDRRFTKFVEVIGRAGGNLRDDLDSGDKGEKTLFAPTNEAIEQMEKRIGKSIETFDQQELSAILSYHLVPEEEFTKEDLVDGELMETALISKKLDPKGKRSQVIRVAKYGGRVELNFYAQVIDADMEASNGYVHAIADVLMTPTSLFDTLTLIPGEFSIHALALELTGLSKKANEVSATTGFVPSNSAWESLGYVELMELFQPRNRKDLKKILEMHYAEEVVYAHELAEEGQGTKNICRDRSTFASGFGATVSADGQWIQYPSGAVAPHHGQWIEKDAKTWAGDKIKIKVRCAGKGKIVTMVDESIVSVQDIPANNGVVHVLSYPILPNMGGGHHGGSDDKKNRRRNPNQGAEFGGESWAADEYDGKYAAPAYGYFGGKAFGSGYTHGFTGNEYFGDKAAYDYSADNSYFAKVVKKVRGGAFNKYNKKYEQFEISPEYAYKQVKAAYKAGEQ